uniref:Uncharacterized protein LOC116944174 isoform X1 n=2 Tax=Petromyzon marinus TaxID=7757 RepID=A0AAJ7WXM2_PETMA|nr:uncharacterized protein LOC116944174 isoform X1 [Petromyzon marinus]
MFTASPGVMRNMDEENAQVTGPVAEKANRVKDSPPSQASCPMEQANELRVTPESSSEDRTSQESLTTVDDSDAGLEPCMIWSLMEALEKQTEQIGVSACGATAVVNVMQALGVPVEADIAESAVGTKLRANEAPLAEYLLSRSVAGATHEQLLVGAHEASRGRVLGRFFHMYPARAVPLAHWLRHWMRRGAVPVVTMNMQVAVPPGEEVPDAWHHQMVFGVGREGIYMTNPLDFVGTAVLSQRLSSPSELLVRREDVEARVVGGSGTIPCLEDDPRWHELHVAEQVERMLCAQSALGEGQDLLTTAAPTHITIPAAYKSGVTLFVPCDSPVAAELLAEPELPLL